MNSSDETYKHLQALFLGRTADGVQQVGLSQTNPTIKEQRIVSPGRTFGDGHRSGVRQTVAGADHEIIESIARI